MVVVGDVTSTNVQQAGLYLFFQIIAAFASLTTLIIIVIVMSFMLKKLGISNFIKIRKN